MRIRAMSLVPRQGTLAMVRPRQNCSWQGLPTQSHWSGDQEVSPLLPGPNPESLRADRIDRRSAGAILAGLNAANVSLVGALVHTGCTQTALHPEYPRGQPPESLVRVGVQFVSEHARSGLSEHLPGCVDLYFLEADIPTQEEQVTG